MILKQTQNNLSQKYVLHSQELEKKSYRSMPVEKFKWIIKKRMSPHRTVHKLQFLKAWKAGLVFAKP